LLWIALEIDAGHPIDRDLITIALKRRGLDFMGLELCDAHGQSAFPANCYLYGSGKRSLAAVVTSASRKHVQVDFGSTAFGIDTFITDTCGLAELPALAELVLGQTPRNTCDD